MRTDQSDGGAVRPVATAGDGFELSHRVPHLRTARVAFGWLATAALLAGCGTAGPGATEGATGGATGISTASAAPVRGAPDAGRLVALGDSYTAGPGVSEPEPGSPARCRRSSENYPRLVARALDLELTDASCVGARPLHLREAQHPGVPPQLDALAPGTRAVILGIGGNVGNLFGDAMAECSAVRNRPSPTASPCSDAFGDGIATRLAVADDRVRRALREITQRTDGAVVLVVGYPNLFPVDSAGRRSCNPRTVPFAPGDLRYLNEVTQALNGALAEAAESAGALFVDTYAASVGHDMCRDRSVRWIEPAAARGAARFHPNASGHRATAGAVLEVLRGQGVVAR